MRDHGAGSDAAKEDDCTRRQLLSRGGLRRRNERSEIVLDSWVTVSRRAMACTFKVTVGAADGRAVRAAGECLDEVERLESILSIFRPDSDASRINREAATRPVSAGPELIELLQLCQRVNDESEGAFDITTGALTECWGFQDRNPRLPTDDALSSARKRVSAGRINIGTNDAVSFGAAGMRVNFGAVGKGYALDRGAQRMTAHGIDNALFSAGYSSVLAIGAGPEGEGWSVGLRHPLARDRRMATVRLHSCAMGTSSQEEQWFENGGKRYGHILDPRTGFPPTEVQSVSVIADTAALADALATAFFVGGQELAERYCTEHEGTVAVMLLSRGLSRSVVIGARDGAVVEVENG